MGTQECSWALLSVQVVDVFFVFFQHSLAIYYSLSFTRHLNLIIRSLASLAKKPFLLLPFQVEG